MDKTYNPQPVEEKWYQFWMEKGYFHADVHSKKKAYTIVIPPPNVTDRLHMGHALNNTLQDILIRQKRMEGFEAEWLPGVDHAGIATQNQVEKSLAREGLSRHDIGRAEFFKRAQQWKEKYGGVIIEQLKRLGSSCDWSRERYTMDEGLTHAVLFAFVQYYEKGYIYRGEYIVNWCPRCESAISDLEVCHEEWKGLLFTIQYPVSGQEHRYSISVATTRPETMLGDTAVAVHPEDERYKSFIGKRVKLPLVGREIPIIADEWVDPHFGTGAVKVTPSHDPNDFEIAKRHHLNFIKILNEKGRMTPQAGQEFEGLTREDCRERVLQNLQKENLLKKTEEYFYTIGKCDRCNTIIEPLISTQWFLRMKDLSRPAIQVVNEGKIRFFPERWTKVYLDWMENIRDWCISRQLWWGHRIPAWWCIPCNEGKYIKSETYQGPRKSHVASRYYFFPDAKPIISIQKPKQCPECKYEDLIEEEDVLDTWFSSALWPFSTLGWPENNQELKRFYPTQSLLTASGILNLWVSRMIFSGLEFMKEIPFRHVYIHSTVLNVEGKRMAKSLGTGVDPVLLMEKYGTDALRFTLASLETQGQSFRFWENRCEMGRNFSNKIWNASRFLFMNLDESKSQIINLKSQTSNLELSDRWILSRYNRLIQSTTDSLNSYQFHEMAMGLYEFFWHEFCDWYLEWIKPRLTNHETRNTSSSLGIALAILEGILRLLHPIMPFITEEIWQMLPLKVRRGGKESLMISIWPTPDSKFYDERAEENMATIIHIITSIRNIRSEMNIPPLKEADCLMKVEQDGIAKILKENEEYVKSLSKVKHLRIDSKMERPRGSASSVLSEMEIYLPLEGLIDFEVERNRIKKEVEKITTELNRLHRKLESEDFLSRAPNEVVEEARLKRGEFEKKLITLQKNLKFLEE